MATRKVVVKEAWINTDSADFDQMVKSAKPGATCHLIVGLDAERLGNQQPDPTVDDLVRCLGEFQRTVEKADPHAFAATVFVLDRPQRDKGRLDEADVDQLVEAGACFREKEEEFYKPSVDLATALRQDLITAQVISCQETETFDDAQSPPQPSTETEVLLQYYGDPDFVWPEDVIKQLFGDDSADTTDRLPR